MTKKDIVKAISEQIGMTQLKTKEIVQQTFDAIIDTLVREERIELRNFGVFEVKKRAARKARNPRTGTRVDVPEKYVVTFKPGKEMEERVKLLEQRKAEEKAQAAAQEAASSEAHQTQPTGTVSPAPSTIPQPDTSQPLPSSQSDLTANPHQEPPPNSGSSF